ncbi:hypothetical protein GGR35_000600 [Mucilaginibacter phyllosphaerae]|uniref:Uncharacterized protein n=1 Tax=Mucilaginibacter phyllosphaerae TaxID=1812349 RepID=A0ABR6I4Q0_9SPHI|nr:hypothetical protein [Mucilaginibacter phyllosphaerae]
MTRYFASLTCKSRYIKKKTRSIASLRFKSEIVHPKSYCKYLLFYRRDAKYRVSTCKSRYIKKRREVSRLYGFNPKSCIRNHIVSTFYFYVGTQCFAFLNANPGLFKKDAKYRVSTMFKINLCDHFVGNYGL